MKTRKCAYENCPAHYVNSEWIVRSGIEIPDTVLEHEHGTALIFPAENAEDAPAESCDGNAGPTPRSPQFEASIGVLNNYIVARKQYEEAYRYLVGNTLLMPEHEHEAFVSEALAVFERHGFEIPRERGVTFIDISDLFRG